MDTDTLILALLREARNSGFAPMLRTTLIKFLYLLDVYTAEETQGQTISGLEWRFIHFGPFSPAAATALDNLAGNQIIYARRGESGDKEFMLYDLADNSRAPTLTEIGIAGWVQNHIQADMRRYSKNLSKLLDHVYFRTSPMKNAHPGEVIDFSSARKVTIDDVRAIEMKKLRPKAIKVTRQKIKEMIAARKSQEPVVQGPIDEVYAGGLGLLDGASLEIGLTGNAKIKN